MWCLPNALTYEDREEDVEDDEHQKELEIGLESLADKYGFDKIVDSIVRMSRIGYLRRDRDRK
jgi:benzoyl-CoA reductase subunit BamC